MAYDVKDAQNEAFVRKPTDSSGWGSNPAEDFSEWGSNPVSTSIKKQRIPLIDHPQENESDADLQLRRIVQLGRGREAAAEVARLISRKCNINRSFDFENRDFAGFKIKKFKRFHGPPLVVAAMRGDLEIVKSLFDHNAHIVGPQSHYSLTAGLRRVKMAAPPVFVPASSGDQRVLRELLRMKAHVDEMATFDGKSNTSVLWSACYHGNTKIVKELLNQIQNDSNAGLLDGHEFIDRPATHQDNETEIFTPLHVASQQGYVQIVKDLIEFRATIERANDADPDHHTPLTEAIDHDRQDVVKELITNRAHILSQAAYEWLFYKKNNMVTISAAAEGLRQACALNGEDTEDYISQHLDCTKLASFLSTPGDAKMHIVRVMFRACTIGKTSQRDRRVFRHAHLANGKFNACLGPVSDFFPVTEKTQAHPRVFSFMNNLLPGELHPVQGRSGCCWCCHRQDRSSVVKVPVQVFQCVLRNIHTTPEVLIALAEADNDSMFQDYGVQAIIKLGWLNIHSRYTSAFFLNLLFAVILLFVARDLNGDKDAEDESEFLKFLSKYGRYALPTFFAYGLGMEILQIVGYCHMGKVFVYLSDRNNYVDWIRFVFTGYSVFMILFEQDAMREGRYPNDPGPGRLVFAFTVFFRWMKVLYSLRGYEFAGSSVLPVLRAVGEVWPFLFVVAFPLIGFVHAYYVIGVYERDLFRAFTIVFRLGIVGDFDLEEMEDVDPWFTLPQKNETMHQHHDEQKVGVEDPEFTQWRPYVVMVFVVASILITITMMNIFIAVLCDTYGTASQVKNEIFWRNRARIVLDETFKKQAEKDAFTYLSAFLCARRNLQPALLRPLSSDINGKSEEFEKDADVYDWDYVWFCQPAADAMRVYDGQTGEEEDEDDLYELKAKLDHMDHRMHSMRHEMHHMLHDLRRDILCFGRHDEANRRPGEAKRNGGVGQRPHSAPATRRLSIPMPQRSFPISLKDERTPPISPFISHPWSRISDNRQFQGNASARQRDECSVTTNENGNLPSLQRNDYSGKSFTSERTDDNSRPSSLLRGHLWQR